MKKRSLYVRTISALLAAVMLFPVICLTGCADTTENGSATVETDGPDMTTETDVTGRQNTPDRLPEDLNFGDVPITVLCRAGDDDTKMEFLARSDSGEVVETAVYERNVLVSQRLGIEFDYVTVSDTRHSGATINDMLSRSVSTGGDDYDIVANHMSQTTTSVLAGYFLNLNTLDYLDWTGPWWNASYSDEVTIEGRQYLAVGELALSYISGAFVTYFNTVLWDKYHNGEDLYQLTWDGKWTLEAMTGFIQDLWVDNDGDGKASKTDIWGLYQEAPSSTCDGLAGGAGVRYSARDSETDTYEVLLGDETTFAFTEAMEKLLYESNGAYVSNSDTFVEVLDAMSEDRALFIVNILGGTGTLRSMTHDYGILPMPKLSEKQEKYTGFVQNGFSVVGIPSSNSSPDRAAAVIEALCAESYRHVTPAYYETALKEKYARDPQAAAMLDVVIAGLRFDFVYCYNQSLSASAACFRNILSSKSSIGAASSTVSSIKRKLGKDMNTLANKIAKLKV